MTTVCRCSTSLNEYQEGLREALSKAHLPTILERDAPERYLNSPLSFSLDSEVRKATYSLLNLCKDNAFEGRDKIPPKVFFNAKGLAFLTILKIGFVLTGRIGTGLVISRLKDGSWSAPSAIGISGAGWG